MKRLIVILLSVAIALSSSIAIASSSITFKTDTLPDGKMGYMYIAAVTAESEAGEIYFQSTDKPDWITVDYSGAINGIPPEPGKYNLTIIATDRDGQTATKAFIFSILSDTPIATLKPVTASATTLTPSKTNTAAPTKKPTTTPTPKPTIKPTVKPTPTKSPATSVYIAPYSGKKYHKNQSCRGLNNNRGIEKLSIADAKSQGYTPCGICKPPSK